MSSKEKARELLVQTAVLLRVERFLDKWQPEPGMPTHYRHEYLEAKKAVRKILEADRKALTARIRIIEQNARVDGTDDQPEEAIQ